MEEPDQAYPLLPQKEEHVPLRRHAGEDLGLLPGHGEEEAHLRPGAGGEGRGEGEEAVPLEAPGGEEGLEVGGEEPELRPRGQGLAEEGRQGREGQAAKPQEEDEAALHALILGRPLRPLWEGG